MIEKNISTSLLYPCDEFRFKIAEVRLVFAGRATCFFIIVLFIEWPIWTFCAVFVLLRIFPLWNLPSEKDAFSSFEKLFCRAEEFDETEKYSLSVFKCVFVVILLGIYWRLRFRDLTCWSEPDIPRSFILFTRSNSPSKFGSLLFSTFSWMTLLVIWQKSIVFGQKLNSFGSFWMPFSLK